MLAVQANGKERRMRLGLNLGYWGAGGSDGVELAQEAERLGFDSVWTAEA
jgi:alkanesulfonate monooxygenase SsuD/methylene tetrahydromethanopterin reductase-like flavin-dependent oxidoreductase (luciferase family)